MKKDLTYATLEGVEFIGSFDNVNIVDTQFQGSNYEEIINFENDFRQKVRKLVRKYDK